MIPVVCLVACSLVLAACGGGSEVGPRSLVEACPETIPLAEAPTRHPPGDDEPIIDDLYAEVAERVPAFGGAWVDEPAGRLMINVTDGSAASARAARDALLELTDHDIAAYDPVPVRAAYSFDRLKAWYDPSTYEILSLPGAVSSDIDDKANVLRFGFEDPDALRVCAEAILVRLGVPDDAFVIEQQDPVRAEPLRSR